MSTRWSLETMLATLRAVRLPVRQFGTSLFWGSVLLVSLVAVFVMMAWRVHAHTQADETKSLQITKAATPAAASHSAAAIDLHAAPAPLSTPSKSSTPQASVTVNGQSVPLPASGNGEVHKVVTSTDGTTKVNVSVHSDSSSNSSSTSSFSLNVQSSTDASAGQSP